MPCHLLRKICVSLLLMALFLCGIAFCEEISSEMIVVNCEEWVSLRQEPATSSQRLCKVALGETVYHCSPAENGFIYCEYRSYQGYVLSEYLLSAEKAVQQKAVLFDYDDLAQSEGMVLCDYVGENTVLARRILAQDGETLRIGVFTDSFEAIWGYETISSEKSEPYSCDAFVGGTAENPWVMVYNSQTGLIRLNAQTGAVEWILPAETADFGKGICHAVTSDGTIYLAGMEQPALTAVSVSGAVLWQTSPGENISAAKSIIISEDRGADVFYSNPEVIIHFKADGICTGQINGSDNDSPVSESAVSNTNTDITVDTLPGTTWRFASLEFSAEITIDKGSAEMILTKDEKSRTITGMSLTFTVGSMYEGCPNSSWWAWLDGGNANLRFTCYYQSDGWKLELQGNYSGSEWPQEMKNAESLLFELSSGSLSFSRLESPMLWMNLDDTGFSIQKILSTDNDSTGEAAEAILLNGSLTVASYRVSLLENASSAISRLTAICGAEPDELSYIYENCLGQAALHITYQFELNGIRYYGDDTIFPLESMSCILHLVMPETMRESYASVIENIRKNMIFVERSQI